MSTHPVSQVNLNDYFSRIGYDGPREATLDVLRALHDLHPRAIAFENLDPFAARHVSVSLPAVVAKLVESRRGGYCFEHNTLFAHVLMQLGFEVEPMGPKSVAIQSVPAGIAANDSEGLLTEILDGIEREDVTVSIDTLQSKIAASTACHAAIKINMPLEQSKMEWLLSALAKTDCPMSCPHGRPIAMHYSTREILKAFHRM